MTKKILIALFSFIFSQLSYSQNQTNNWYFGTLSGVSFNGGTPTVITNSPLNTAEGCASISDAAGNLLFYTDGMQVWNKNNVQMPNGFGLFGDPSTTQSALVVPDPGNINLYYIFTIDDEGEGNGFNYSVVDMTLQAGDGDVTLKNVFLRDSITEKLAAVYHCNSTDVWVTVHDWHNDLFLSYLVTATGVNPPVSSNTGIIHNRVHGQMKFNSAGTKIACAIGYQDTVEVLDFDNSTGIVSNPLSLALGHHAYGLEFSPDNSKLYVTYYDVASTSWLGQFDLNAGNIQASLLPLYTNIDPVLYALQLASDNKIYVTKEITAFLGVINSPNVAGAGCNYVDNAINLDPLGFGSVCMLGLPGFIQSYFNPNFPNIPCTNITANFQSSDTSFCTGTCVNFTDLSTGSVTSWNWNFQGAGTLSSTAQNPSGICYSSPGTYSVSLIVSNGTSSDTITSTIVVTSATANAGSDATITAGSTTQLNATGNLQTLLWSPGNSLSDSTIANPIASPTVTTTYYLSGTDANGCSASDSVTVFVNCAAFVSAGTDVTIVAGNSTQINASGSLQSFLWSPSTGLSDSAIANPVASPSVTTNYFVTGIDAFGCSAGDSITVFVDINCGEVFVPTAFSPNNDNSNDFECVFGNCITSFQFSIYDRWGEKVFETSDQKICWDGTYRGKALNPGVYAYFLVATLVGGEGVSLKGNVSLVR
jgi:gliding motility-associated-like protein